MGTGNRRQPGTVKERDSEIVLPCLSQFPLEDFMFQLSKLEFVNWRPQFVISNFDRIGLRHPPMAFTEQGVAMLSSVLRSSKAIQVNIAIMRTFVQLRHLMDNNRPLAMKVDLLERKYDEQFRAVFEAIKRLVVRESEAHGKDRRRTGFHP